MSDSILPLQIWPEGIAQASVPANDNALRLEAMSRPCLGVANDETGSDNDSDVWIVGSAPAGVFSTFTEGDVTMYRSGSWYAWAPVDGLRLIVAGVRKRYDDGTSTWVDDLSSNPDAEDVPYDNLASGLAATDVQAAIDELEGMVAGVAVTSVNGDTGAVIVPVPVGIACSDETTALTAGAAKVTFRMPFAMTLTSARASLTNAQTSGSIFTVDINEGGTTILSTKLTIDNTEKTSTTAATPAVISDSALADDAEMTVDIDQVGDGTAKGLKIWLIGYQA